MNAAVELYDFLGIEPPTTQTTRSSPMTALPLRDFTAAEQDKLAAIEAAHFWAGPVELPESFPIDLFWSRVDKSGPTECWIWRGASDGIYGRLQHQRKRYAAHRTMWLLVHGSIDPTLPLDHFCRVTLCVNPDHLEPVTIRENTMRGVSAIAQNSLKTHCPKRHPYSGDNLAYARGGQRYCRACKREQCRARRERQRHDPTLPEPCEDCDSRFRNRIALTTHRSHRHKEHAA